MADTEKEQYNQIYIQKQEQLLVQYMRKSIDDEIKIIMLNGSVFQLNNTIKEWEAKFDESQNNVASQNEIMLQATRSIEDLTNKTKFQQDQINNLNNELTEKNNRFNTVQNDINSANILKDKAFNELELIKNSIEQYKREIARQNEEMMLIFEENKQLKSKTQINSDKKVLKKKDDNF